MVRKLAASVWRRWRAWRHQRWLQRRGVRVAGSVRLYGRPRLAIAPGSEILLGDGVVLSGKWTANSLNAPEPCVLRTLGPGASIAIGADSGLTSVTIAAALSVEIGARALIGTQVMITDSDHHPVRPRRVSERRKAPIPEPRATDGVCIEDDVFVGARSIILKGVTVGQGAVVAAGSVVTRDVPPMVVVAGNPAQVVSSVKV